MKTFFLLFMIAVFGCTLRFWGISDVPPGLNRDEASIGYTAYSILKTGADEYGRFLPLSFESFGDWKLPLYIYLTIPSIAVFGLTDFAVRFPSVLFASCTIFTVYLLAKLFTGRKDAAFFSAFLFAVSPWSIHLSRNASEASTAIFFTTLGVVLFLRSGGNVFRLSFAALFLAVPLYMYHGNHIFSLLLYAGVFIVSLWKNYSRRAIVIALFVFAVFAGLIFQKTLFSADKTKLSGLFAASDKAVIHERIILDRVDHRDNPSLVGSFFHNKAVFTLQSVMENYLKGFSPEFLFITGGNNLQHNIPNFGNLYLWEAPFLAAGVYFFLKRKNSSRMLFFWWLLIAPVAASITKDAPHTNRMASFLPIPQILVAYGFIMIVQQRMYTAFGLLLLFLANFFLWNDRYFVHFPLRRAADWGGGFTKLVEVVDRIEGNYTEIIMERPDYSPYIYFLFYGRIDPQTFQQTVRRYPVDQGGFHHVRSFGKLVFQKLDWGDEEILSDDLLRPDRLLISWAESSPAWATASATVMTPDQIGNLREKYGDAFGLQSGDVVVTQRIDTIRLINGEPQFYLTEVKKLQRQEANVQ